MKSIYYTILLPIVSIVTNIFLIFNLDKELIYREFDIKYRNINPISKNIGIEKYITSGGTCITFKTANNLEFERRYVGIVQMLICHFYYNDLIGKRKKKYWIIY